MNSTDTYAIHDEHDLESSAPEVTVRRNARLTLVVFVVALLLGVGYLVRGVGGGGIGAWAPAVLLLALAVQQGLTLRDARTPLLVADDLGIRLRLAGDWRGLPWTEVDEVLVQPRMSVAQDGRLVVVPADLAGALKGLDARGVREVRRNRAMYGAPLVVPLGLSTSVVGQDSLVADLTDLAAARARVVEVAGPIQRDDDGHDRHDGHDRPEHGDQTGDRDVAGSPRPGPVREPQPAVAEQSHDSDEPFDQESYDDQHVGRPERSAAHSLTASFGSVRTRLAAATRIGADPVLVEETLDDFEPEVVPLIGPRLREARERVGLSLAEVSGRTRIRAHVLAAMEEEDFEPCGGDFYARGHLRAVAGVLGMDPAELVADFDAAYAHEPVSASAVLRAGEGTGHGLLGRIADAVRATLQGPRWSVVAAVGLCLVLAWSVARFATAGGDETASRSSQAQLSSQAAKQATTRLVVRSPDRATRVVVRVGDGTVVHRSLVRPGHPTRVQGIGPLSVSAGRPGALHVSQRDAHWRQTGIEQTVGRTALRVG